MPLLNRYHLLKAPDLKLSSVTLTLAIALYLILFDNASFWSDLLTIFHGFSFENIGFLISVFICLIGLLTLYLSFFSFPYLFKPIVIFILVTASFAGYFMDTYGIMIDRHMMQNIIETDSGEVIELLNLKLFYHVVLFGLIPSVFVYRTNIQYASFPKEVLRKGWVILISFVVIAASFFCFYKDYMSLGRNNRYIRHLVNPINVSFALGSKIKHSMENGSVTILPIGKDARLDTHPQTTRRKKTLTIFVVGEAARAANFSLNGYPRNTNPLLSNEDIINFSNFYSCGTATAISVPCMFSHFDRASYSDSKAKQHENLLDVLSHAGVSVLWRDNNSGCKGVCNRVETVKMSHSQVADYCNSTECHDEILLQDLQEYVDEINNDAFIVLHQKGSHGPAYYLRVPETFEAFTPECSTNQLQECQKEEIVNAYDNTILYTDYFLSQVVQLLKRNSDQFNTAMIYVSDHGQSLGEHGIYLHGLPYFIAPDEQKHIPFILWFSDEFADTLGIDKACVREHGSAEYSHDNIFHSVLGLTGIKTSIYDAKLDIFAECRN